MPTGAQVGETFAFHYAATPLDGLLKQWAILSKETVKREGMMIAVISDKVQDRLSEGDRRALKQYLVSLPEELAQRTVLFGSRWQDVSHENPALVFVEGDEGSLFARLRSMVEDPANVMIQVIGEDRWADAVAMEHGFNPKSVQFVPDIADIRALIVQLGRALGVPEDVIHKRLEEILDELMVIPSGA
jgi:hypothetical protein